jgi:hypothetical protein
MINHKLIFHERQDRRESHPGDEVNKPDKPEKKQKKEGLAP